MALPMVLGRALLFLTEWFWLARPKKSMCLRLILFMVQGVHTYTGLQTILNGRQASHFVLHCLGRMIILAHP